MGAVSLVKLSNKPQLKGPGVRLPASKSESNRALILNALSENPSPIDGLSTAEDTQILLSLLSNGRRKQNVQDGGTVMRFLTAYYAVRGENKILTGTTRMNQRPIKDLVEVLMKIGAKIRYLGKSGFPPIEIEGFEGQLTNDIFITGEISSQYISALLMIAPSLPQGLRIHIEGKVLSKPYIELTLQMLEQCGIEYSWISNSIQVDPQPISKCYFKINPDWTAASYFYSFMALSSSNKIVINNLDKNSAQGDRQIVQFMEPLGVSTTFTGAGIELQKTNHVNRVEFDFSNNPDLFPTIAVICAAKGIHAILTGVENLRLKESDRVAALEIELRKINGQMEELSTGNFEIRSLGKTPDHAQFETYKDHRMAMAFAPLAACMDIEIMDPFVVVKSFPEFWEEFEKMGIAHQFINRPSR